MTAVEKKKLLKADATLENAVRGLKRFNMMMEQKQDIEECRKYYHASMHDLFSAQMKIKSLLK